MVKALVFDISIHGFESHCPDFGSVTQWLECTLDKREVGSSILLRPYYRVEQLVARQAHDLKVVGSSPTLVICLLGEIGKHDRLKIYSS